MDEKAHIAEAISLAGGLSAVAKRAQPKRLTPWAVSKWVDSLPPGRALFLAELTGWRKTPHQLCPALYPNPTDGLPPDVVIRMSNDGDPCLTARAVRAEGVEHV